MKSELSFEEAFSIVSKAQKAFESLTTYECMAYPMACAILAFEYVKVRDVITPA